MSVNGSSRLIVAAVIAALLAVLVAGCQTQSGAKPRLSVEEARKLAADIQRHPSIKMPPRTVLDIEKLLSKHSNTRTRRYSEFLDVANLQNPQTTDRVALWRFYRDRGRAAHFLGRNHQASKDLAISLGHVKATGRNDKQPTGVHPRAVVRLLMLTHEAMGNIHEALQLSRQYAELTQQTETTSGQFFLARSLGWTGDFKGADAAIPNLRRAAERSVNWSDEWSSWGPVTRAVVPLAEGNLALAKGEYEAAEAHYQEALAAVDNDIENGARSGPRSSEGHTLAEERIRFKLLTHQYLAQALLGLGHLVEAEVQARVAVKGHVSNFGRYSGRTAESLQTLTEIISEQSRFEDAELLARAAVNIYETMEADQTSVTRSRAMRAIGDALVGQKSWKEALSIYDKIIRDLEEDPAAQQQVLDSNLNWSIALLKVGRAREASQRLKEAHRRISDLFGTDQYRTAEAMGLLATTLFELGHRASAEDAFSKALPILLSYAEQAEEEDRGKTARQLRLRVIVDAYIELLCTGESTKSIAKAFRIAQFVRGQAVQQALAASAARGAIADPVLADLARREQDTRRQITALNRLLVDATDATRTRFYTSILREERATILDKIRERFPEYFELMHPKPLSVAEVRGVLKSTEAVIATYSTDRQTYVWAVPYRGDVKFAAVPKGRDSIEFDV